MILLFHAKKEFIVAAMVILLRVPGFGQVFIRAWEPSVALTDGIYIFEGGGSAVTYHK